jgi:hypothetical protein
MWNEVTNRDHWSTPHQAPVIQTFVTTTVRFPSLR